jgi:hypothetical protein
VTGLNYIGPGSIFMPLATCQDKSTKTGL